MRNTIKKLLYSGNFDIKANLFIYVMLVMFEDKVLLVFLNNISYPSPVCQQENPLEVRFTTTASKC